MKKTIFVLLLISIASNDALARDLGQASNSFMATVMSIRLPLVTGAMVSGGLMYAFPFTRDWGRGVLSSGVIGGLVAYAGPSLISFMQQIFGA